MPSENDSAPMSPADSRGAIDLSAHAASAGTPSEAASQAAAPASAYADGGAYAGATAGVTGGEQGTSDVPLLDIPLIRAAGEADFETVAATSRALPVVIALWSAHSLESKQLVATMEGLAREYAGAFQLVKIDVDTSPAVAQAFQVQSLPSVVALVGGRPVPLFQGAAVREQILPVLTELLTAAGQMGVAARIRVAEEDTAAPIPEEHLAPLQAEENGDYEEAARLWDKVIELNPRDEDAKSHAARVHLLQRAQEADGAGDGDPAVAADAAFAAGRQREAFTILLDLIAEARGEERDALRTRLLDLFRVAGNTEEVRAARLYLSTLLMV